MEADEHKQTDYFCLAYVNVVSKSNYNINLCVVGQ